MIQAEILISGIGSILAVAATVWIYYLDKKHKAEDTKKIKKIKK